jgi:hypothetical protein
MFTTATAIPARCGIHLAPDRPGQDEAGTHQPHREEEGIDGPEREAPGVPTRTTQEMNRPRFRRT